MNTNSDLTSLLVLEMISSKSKLATDHHHTHSHEWSYFYTLFLQLKGAFKKFKFHKFNSSSGSLVLKVQKSKKKITPRCIGKVHL